MLERLTDVNYLLTMVGAAHAAHTMRAYERAAFDVLGVRRFVYSRKAGPQANKNYRTWAKLALKLKKADADPGGFMFSTFRHWQLLKQRGSIDAAQEIPYPTQLLGDYYLRTYLTTAPWRAGLRLTSYYAWEIEEGAEALHGFSAGASIEDVMPAVWPGLPPAFLALSVEFSHAFDAGAVNAALAPAQIERVVTMRKSLIAAPHVWRELCDVYVRCVTSKWGVGGAKSGG